MKSFILTLLLSLMCLNETFGMSNRKIIALLQKEPDVEIDVLSCDKEWETRLDYASILKIDTCYVMYYRAIDSKKHTVYCRALSSDGINWGKHDVCKIEYNGSIANNIFSNSIDGVSVEYVDGVYWLISDRLYDENYNQTRGLVLFKSDDGVNFEVYKHFNVPFFCDSQNEIMWDPTTQTFKIYLRSWYRSQNPRIDYHHSSSYRSVSLLEIPTLDFTLSSALSISENAVAPSLKNELPRVLENKSDIEDFDIYCAYVHKYRDNLYIAYPINYYHTDNKKRGGKRDNDGYATIGFWTSKDGRVFNELKRNYITNGDNWLEFCIGHIETEDMFIHYYIPFDGSHVGGVKKNTIKARIHYKNRKKQ